MTLLTLLGGSGAGAPESPELLGKTLLEPREPGLEGELVLGVAVPWLLFAEMIDRDPPNPSTRSSRVGGDDRWRGVPQSAISQLESGKIGVMNLAHLEKLAAVFGVKPAYLITDVPADRRGKRG